jgi:hypothetical protein
VLVVVLVLIAVLALAVIAATTRRPGEEQTVPFDPVRPEPDLRPDED